MMTKQTTIDSPLLESLLANAECYLMELDYWYDLAEDGDGGSVNHASSTVYYDFDGDYDKSLKDFKGEITELKTTIRKAKEVYSPKSAKSHALLTWEKMFRDGDIEDAQSECIADALANARKELDNEPI
jgi:hypothetical protein